LRLKQEKNGRGALVFSCGAWFVHPSDTQRLRPRAGFDIGHQKTSGPRTAARWDCIQPSDIGGETIVSEPQDRCADELTFVRNQATVIQLTIIISSHCREARQRSVAHSY
jgi:hypothetical protein